MSQRNWVPSPPIGVGLAVVLLLCLSALLSEEQKYAECRAGRADKDCDQVISRAARAIGAPVIIPETPARKPQPDRDEWRAEQTIQAQWDQVAWAFWSALAAWVAVVVGAVGIYFVKRTLDATRDAVEQSARATDAAIVAARASEAAVTVAQQTAERQLRAYVMVEGALMEDFIVGKVPTPKLVFRNFGVTPAEGVTYWATLAFAPFPLTLPFPKRPKDKIPSTSLGPGAGYVLRVNNTLGELVLEDWVLLSAGTYAIFVMGEVRYRDCFGIQRETDFLLFTGGPVGVAGPLFGYLDGNSTT